MKENWDERILRVSRHLDRSPLAEILISAGGVVFVIMCLMKIFS